jgi:glycosyltransferase involved in cell wall biosynthesis
VPPAISCVIPVFNGEAFLAEALDSVFAQTLAPDEVIVVDDGSTDGTQAVLRRYGDRVRYVHQQNKGPAAARNRGIGMARGDLFAFLDADDLWLPEKLVRQIACFAERPNLDVSLTQVRNFWIDELHAEMQSMQGHSLSVPALPGFVPQTMLARRRVFDRIGPFDEGLRIGEDTDWFLRATDGGAVLELVPQVLVLRRFHHSNLTRDASAVRNNLADAVWRSLRRRRPLPPSDVKNGASVSASKSGNEEEESRTCYPNTRF